jgi:MFS transporter, DHA1 family, tetracycline resistance protein
LVIPYDKNVPAPRNGSLPLVMLVMFLDVLCYGMTLPLLPLYAQTLGGGVALAGAVASGYAAMQLLSGPLLGALSDRHGRKPVLSACLVGTVLSYAIVASALLSGQPLWPALIVAVLIDGVTGGNLTTAYAYVSDSATPERRAIAIGAASAAFGLGVMAGPALGAALLAPDPSQLWVPGVAACAIAVVNALIGAVLLPESLPADRRAARIDWTPASGFTTLRDLLRGASSLRGLFAAVFFANLAFSGLQANFPLFSAVRFGWSAQQTSLFFAFVGLCAVVTQGGLIRVAQRVCGDRALVLGGLAVLAAGLAAIAAVGRGELLYPAAAVAAIGSGLCLPVLSALLSNALPTDRQGALMGATQTVIALANIAAPLIASAAFAGIAINAPYWIAAGLVGLGFFAAARGLSASQTD